MLYQHHPNIFLNTFSNIFSCREIGNKTHGDLAEIGIDEFINEFMYDYSSIHIGKENYRNKQVEEDLKIIKKMDNTHFYISLKCYGKGHLQLSTDKNNFLFPFLKILRKDENKIRKVKEKKEFQKLLNISTLSLIYDEKQKQFNILVFDKTKFLNELKDIKFINNDVRNRKHPIFIFLNEQEEYILECRYGGKTANALQRGLWSHTINAEKYFLSITGGWLKYNTNDNIKKLFSKSLLSTNQTHEEVIKLLQKDIDSQKITKK